MTTAPDLTSPLDGHRDELAIQRAGLAAIRAGQHLTATEFGSAAGLDPPPAQVVIDSLLARQAATVTDGRVDGIGADVTGMRARSRRSPMPSTNTGKRGTVSHACRSPLAGGEAVEGPNALGRAEQVLDTVDGAGGGGAGSSDRHLADGIDGTVGSSGT